MQKRGLTVIFVLALLTFIAIEQDPVLSVEPAYIELDSTILNGVDASQYGLTDQDAVMILTAKNKISFESFIKFSAESQKVFLNQCVQNSWTEFAGASQVYARFDYENKTYAYAIVTYLADSNSLSLRIFESGIDETQFKALVTKIPPAPQPEVKPEPQPGSDTDTQTGAKTQTSHSGSHCLYERRLSKKPDHPGLCRQSAGLI